MSATRGRHALLGTIDTDSPISCPVPLRPLLPGTTTRTPWYLARTVCHCCPRQRIHELVFCLSHSARFPCLEGQDVVVDCVERGLKGFKQHIESSADPETMATRLEHPKKDRKGS